MVKLGFVLTKLFAEFAFNVENVEFYWNFGKFRKISGIKVECFNFLDFRENEIIDSMEIFCLVIEAYCFLTKIHHL